MTALRWRRHPASGDWYGYEPGATVALVRLEKGDRHWRARIRVESDCMFDDPDLPGGWQWADVFEPEPGGPPGYIQPIEDSSVARLKAHVAAGYEAIAVQARALIEETHTLDTGAADPADRAQPQPSAEGA